MEEIRLVLLDVVLPEEVVSKMVVAYFRQFPEQEGLVPLHAAASLMVQLMVQNFELGKLVFRNSSGAPTASVN